MPVNPGRHVIEAHVGARSAKAEINVAEGANASVPLELGGAGPASASPASPAAAKAPAPAQGERSAVSFGAQAAATDARSRGVPAGVWVGLGVGVAGFALGGVSAGLAAQKKGDFSAACQGTHCPPSERSKVDSYNTMLTLSTVGFIAGGVGLAAAGVFWIAAPRSNEASASVGAYVGPGSAGIQGAF